MKIKKRLLLSFLTVSLLMGTLQVSAGTMYREKFVYPQEYLEYVEKGYGPGIWARTPMELVVDEKDISDARKWGYKTIDEYSDSEKITLYATEKTLTIPKFMKQTYLELGWYESLITLYAPGGRTFGVTPADKQTYLNLGWYDRPVTTLYTLDGRQENFYNEDVDAQCTVGWYREKPVLLYTLDGRREYFLPNEVEAQCAVGWYRKEPVTLYTLDGRSDVFPADSVEEQRSVGWYYWREIEKINELKRTADSYKIGQRVWLNRPSAYYPVGYVVSKNGSTIDVVWDCFYDYEWCRIYSQTDIQIAERYNRITLGNRYTYSADEIAKYK